MPELFVRGEISLSLAGSKTNSADHKARAYKSVCYCLYIRIIIHSKYFRVSDWLKPHD